MQDLEREVQQVLREGELLGLSSTRPLDAQAPGGNTPGAEVKLK